MKPIALLIVMLCLALPLAAQDKPEQGVVFGVGYSQIGTPQLFGYGAYFHIVGSGVYIYSGYEIQPTEEHWPWAGHEIPMFQYRAFAGPCYRFAQIGNLGLWGLGTVGLVSNNDTTTADYGGGGFLTLPISKSWGVLLGGQVNKNALSGTDGAARIGFIYAK